jgi:ketosteroid isomerase-like protein
MGAHGTGIVPCVASRNVELVQQVFAAFEHRDVDAFVGLCAADMVFEPVTARMVGGGNPYRGHDGMRAYLADVARVWQELRLSPDAFHEGADGVVVVTGRVYAWGAGRVIDSPAGWLFRLRGETIVYGRVFETASGALDAAGMAR